jgi:hypothetical protein
MRRVIQRGTHEIVHGGVHDYKILSAILLGVQNLHR